MTGSKTEESPTSPTSPISPTSTTSRTSTETECERTSERTTNRNRTTKRESNRKKRNRGVSKDDVKIPGREGKIKRIKELLEDKRTREKKSIEQYIENNEGGNRE